MHRRTLDPRPNWQKRVEKYGLHYHTINDEPYWDESACYVFAKSKIDGIERASYAIYDMCMALVQHVIDERMFGLFLQPENSKSRTAQATRRSDHRLAYRHSSR